MPLPAYNRAKMTVSGTPGTGAITLGSAVTNFRSFTAAGIANNATVSYVVEDGANWEIGRGTYTSSGTILTRTTVLETSAGGTSPISLTSAAIVYTTIIAEDVQDVLNLLPNGGGAQVSAPYWGIVTRRSADGTTVAMNELKFIESGTEYTPSAATASQACTTGGNTPANLYDGSDSTIADWGEQSVAIVFQYSASMKFDSIRMKARNDSSYAQTPLIFDIVYSLDGKSLTTLCTVMAAAWTAANQNQSFSVPAVAIGGGTAYGNVGAHKHWMIGNIFSFDGSAPSVSEFELHAVVGGPAQIPTGSRSSTPYSGDTVANAYDGNTSTFFACTSAGPPAQFMIYDYDNPVSVIEVVNKTRTDGYYGQGFRQFDILCSDDGFVFQPVCTISESAATPTSPAVFTYPVPASFAGGGGGSSSGAGKAYNPPLKALFPNNDAAVSLVDTTSHGLAFNFDGTSIYSGFAWKEDASLNTKAYTFTARVKLNYPIGNYPGIGIAVGRNALYAGTQYGWAAISIQNAGTAAGVYVPKINFDRSYNSTYYTNTDMSFPPTWFRITWDATGVMNFLTSFTDGATWINLAGTSSNWDDLFGTGSGSGPDSIGIFAAQSGADATQDGGICDFWYEQPGVHNLYDPAY